MTNLNVAGIKRDFPIIDREINGKRLVYLDSASSSQKPLAVLDTMDDVYRTHYANIHRGVYAIAEQATAEYEAARAKVARFVNANDSAEIVFTRNATESINLVAYTWARQNLREGDVIVLSHMEHHANIVPWHMLAA
jgi:cysteine desulfurase/selenocysteine lyase